MSDNGMFWCQELGVVRLGGNNILTQNFRAINHITTATTGFSGLTGNLNSMCDFTSISGNERNSVIGICDSSKMYALDPYLSYHYGLLNTIQNGGSGTDAILAHEFNDILQSKDGYILYTSANHLGVAYKFTASSATATSLTVTSQTFNATYGIDSDAGTNKIYNLTKKEIYTNTTNNPTDTLNFTTAAVTPQAGDVFLVFVDNRFKFNTSSIVDNQYVGQPLTSEWVRQILLFGSEYFTLNGNYLASLDITCQTWSATAKQLPYNTSATCMGINNSQILVGGRAVNNTGKIMLWDGSSDGWLSIVELTTAPQSIQPYKNGWLVFVNGQVLFTDGYQTTRLAVMPDVEVGFVPISTRFNSFLVFDDKIFIGSATNERNRIRCGVYIYDILSGSWSFTPYKQSTGTPTYNTGLTCLYPYVYTTRRVIVYGINGQIGRIFSGATSANKQVVVGYVKLPRKQRVSKIELNLANAYNFYEGGDGKSTSASITVSIGDGNQAFNNEITGKATSTTAIIYNNDGTTIPGTVGQEVEVTDVNYAYAGARSFIESIENAGLSTEAWILDTDHPLPANFTGASIVRTYNLKKCGTKTITASTLLSNLTFSVSNFQSDKLYFEIVISGVAIDIHGINIY